MIEPDDDRCWAGRLADLGGRWPMIPCLHHGRHVIAFSVGIGGAEVHGAPRLRLCDQHFAEAVAAGVIDEPQALSDEEWNLRRDPTRW